MSMSSSIGMIQFKILISVYHAMVHLGHTLQGMRVHCLRGNRYFKIASDLRRSKRWRELKRPTFQAREHQRSLSTNALVKRAMVSFISRTMKLKQHSEKKSFLVTLRVLNSCSLKKVSSMTSKFSLVSTKQ